MYELIMVNSSETHIAGFAKKTRELKKVFEVPQTELHDTAVEWTKYGYRLTYSPLSEKELLEKFKKENEPPKALDIGRNLTEETRLQGVMFGDELYSLHATKNDELVITDNDDYTKIFAVISCDFNRRKWRLF